MVAKESVHCQNPNIYFSGLQQLTDHFIVGFLTSYAIIEFSDPMSKDLQKPNFILFEDEKSAEKDRKGFVKSKFKCDFILDIDGGHFDLYIEPEKQNTNRNEEENNKNNEENNNIDSDNDDENEDEAQRAERQEEIQRNKYLFGYCDTLFNDSLEGNPEIELDTFIRVLFTKIKSPFILIYFNI